MLLKNKTALVTGSTHNIVAINLTGYFLCIQQAGRMMKEPGSASSR